MRLSISSQYSSDHCIGGWSVTVAELQEVAQAVYTSLNNSESEDRLQIFFSPACQDHGIYNFSELLVKLHVEDPKLLLDLIQLKSNNKYVFGNLYDFIDLALGAKHILDQPLTLTDMSPAKYLLGESYYKNEGMLRCEKKTYFYTDQNFKKVSTTRYRISLEVSELRLAFLRLLALEKTLGNKFSIFKLKSMLKNGIDSHTIEQNIAQISNPIELRLHTLFKNKPGRETVLYILPAYDHNGTTTLTKTYLNGNIFTGLDNMLMAIKIHMHYNIKFKVVKTADELFSSINNVSKECNNNKIPYLIIGGHGLFCQETGRCLGFILGEETNDPNKPWLLGDHTNIPNDAFKPLINGTIVFNGCNGLDPASDKITWVDAIASQAKNSTIIAAKEEISPGQFTVRTTFDGKLDFRFISSNNSNIDLTYKINPEPAEQALDAENSKCSIM